MLVRLIKGLFRVGQTYPRESELELPDAEAQALIDRGRAVPVRAAAVEQAVRTAPEQAARRGPGRPRKGLP